MTSPVLRSPSNCASLILAAALGNVSPPMAPASSAVSLHQISGPEALPHTDSPARNQDDDWQLALLSPRSTLSDIWRAYAHNIRLIRKHQDAHPSSDEAAGAGLRLRVELSHCSITMVDPCVPVIADADTGVAMCACTTTMCARTGVAGLLIEDPVKQKRLVPLDEYLVCIHAALGSKIVLITRSDALAPLGFDYRGQQCGMQRRGQSSLTRTYRARSRSPNEYLVGALPTSLPPGAVLRKYAARRGLTAFPSFVESSEADLLAFPLGNAYTPPSATHRTHPEGPSMRADISPSSSLETAGYTGIISRMPSMRAPRHNWLTLGAPVAQIIRRDDLADADAASAGAVLWGERKADVQAGRWRDDSCSPAIDGGCFE
ncbi:hypothetical protein B0H10DRAFT_2435327 [Mycena sp. CBHHK59/15]|nr:hypothetical protein B0H10DRAFT_2435327 [Mycena sp. CBHHK59/15]